jgi:hypothetical protein
MYKIFLVFLCSNDILTHSLFWWFVCKKTIVRHSFHTFGVLVFCFCFTIKRRPAQGAHSDAQENVDDIVTGTTAVRESGCVDRQRREQPKVVLVA